MIVALLGFLCIEFAALLALYALPERREASRYRREHMQIREDDLVYQDLLTRLHMRDRRRAVIAGGKAESHQRNDAESNGKVVAHSSSFPGWSN